MVVELCKRKKIDGMELDFCVPIPLDCRGSNLIDESFINKVCRARRYLFLLIR